MLMFDRATARCWAEIDLDVIEGNYDRARRICGADTAVIPVLKANAYGLGAVKLSRVLAAKGAKLFAVAELGEALEVRRACGGDVLVLGMIAPVQMEDALRAGVIATLYSLEAARAWDAAAARARVRGRAHIKLDTGLHRLGLDAENAAEEALAICRLPHVSVEGLFTHLALREKQADARQIARLLAVRDALRSAGADFGMLHAADSIGMVRYPEYRFDAVRTGAWLYGVVPSRYPNANHECAFPVRFRTRVVQVRRVAAGEYLGYDEEHPLARDSMIATLCAGYADGYPRLNGVGAVEVCGRRAPVAGLVCMDQMTVDVTDIPGVKPGDAVTLLGDGIGVNEYAAWTHANRNEMLSRLGRRVPRVYMRRGEAEEIESGKQ
ncbi:MAG: alanine racemase [Clostridia bacterium]|nr:alanine racemase [Clostridia bacterium]